MITPMMASLADARPDFRTLKKTGWQRQERSATSRIAANVYEFACFNDPDAGFTGGVKETVVHVYCDPGQRLAAENAREVILLAGTGSTGACHYIVSADDYSADFATALETVAAPGAVVTLIERSFGQKRNADRAAIHRLAVAEGVLMGRPVSDILSWDIADPEDYDEVADRIAQVLQHVCAAAVDFHGPVDVAGGVERVWGEEGLAPDRRYMLLMALNVVNGAVEGIVPQFEDDPAAIERIRKDVERLFQDVRATFRRSGPKA
jgi:hypothetical protein